MISGEESNKTLRAYGKKPRLKSDVIIMKNKPFIISVIISMLLFGILCLLSVVLAFSLLKSFASDRLLKVIASAQPGQHISIVKSKFDGLSGPTVLSEQTMFLGSITNEAFCENKMLYKYYVTPQCREATINEKRLHYGDCTK